MNIETSILTALIVILSAMVISAYIRSKTLADKSRLAIMIISSTLLVKSAIHSWNLLENFNSTSQSALLLSFLITYGLASSTLVSFTIYIKKGIRNLRKWDEGGLVSWLIGGLICGITSGFLAGAIVGLFVGTATNMIIGPSITIPIFLFGGLSVGLIISSVFGYQNE